MSRSGVVFAVIVAAIAAAVLAVMLYSTKNVQVSPNTVQQVPPAQPTAIEWIEIAPPLPGEVPETPFDDPEDVIAFLKRRIEVGSISVVESHAKHALMSDIKLMQAGDTAFWATLGPNETPAGTHPLSSRGQQTVWIVGFRTDEPVTGFQINQVAGLVGVTDEHPVVGGGPQGTEIYFIVDDLANVMEAGLLNSMSGVGTPAPVFVWDMADLLTLPESPW